MSNETRTFVVAPGKEHNVIIGGTLQKKTAGQAVEMTEAQFSAFRDKFMTKEQYAAATSGNADSAEFSAGSDPDEEDGLENENPDDESEGLETE